MAKEMILRIAEQHKPFCHAIIWDVIFSIVVEYGVHSLTDYFSLIYFYYSYMYLDQWLTTVISTNW